MDFLLIAHTVATLLLCGLIWFVQVVHYPLSTLKRPPVTIKVPGWKYHLMNSNMDGAAEMDIDHERLIV